jgi:hypothetical protein
MKNKELKKTSLIIFFIFLINIQTVNSLGVTQIVPLDIKLLGYNADLKLNRGDTTRFYFQIQTATSEGKQSCLSSIQNMEPLIINLDENETILEAGEIKNVYGTVTVPSNTPIKIYSGKLNVRCMPRAEGVMGSLIIQNTGLNVRIEIVEKPEETSEVKEKKMMGAFYLWTPLILIVILVACVTFLFKKQRDKKRHFPNQI